MWGERGFALPFQICIPLLFSALIVSESAAAAVSLLLDAPDDFTGQSYRSGALVSSIEPRKTFLQGNR